MTKPLKYIVIAEINAPGVIGEKLRLNTHPSPNELNILCLLATHMNKFISREAISERLGLTENYIKVLLTYIRKKLHPDWTIMSKTHLGVSLIYLGHRLERAERTYMTNVDYTKVDGRRFNRSKSPKQVVERTNIINPKR